jgi:energy-coupling factor transporter transmembrane protein EcfT
VFVSLSTNTEKQPLSCHPATAILLWLFFIVCLTGANPHQLALDSLFFAAILLRAGWHEWLRYLRRSRWLLGIMWLAQVLSTLDVPLWQGVEGLHVTGVLSATVAVWRWMLMLAVLASLMARLSREALLSGLLTVLSPLECLGIHTQRIALRIGLTLHYAERLLQEKVSFAQLSEIQPVATESLQPMVLNRYAFSWKDVVCVVGVLGWQWGIRS